jgi:hypothetical protein
VRERELRLELGGSEELEQGLRGSEELQRELGGSAELQRGHAESEHVRGSEELQRELRGHGDSEHARGHEELQAQSGSEDLLHEREELLRGYVAPHDDDDVEPQLGLNERVESLSAHAGHEHGHEVCESLGCFQPTRPACNALNQDVHVHESSSEKLHALLQFSPLNHLHSYQFRQSLASHRLQLHVSHFQSQSRNLSPAKAPKDDTNFFLSSRMSSAQTI